jgi:4-hydroxy-tetrahydrodipicolinate synthase
MKIIQGRPKDFLVLSGDDFITLPLIAAGGDGVISVIANTIPRSFTDMVRAALRWDLTQAQQSNLQLLDLYRLLFLEGNPSGVKAALEAQGICSRDVRLPLIPMSESNQQLIHAELQKIQA